MATTAPQSESAPTDERPTNKGDDPGEKETTGAVDASSAKKDETKAARSPGLLDRLAAWLEAEA